MYNFANGEIYDGTWKEGLMHGTGIYSYPDNSEFYGTFVEGIKTHGKQMYSCGDVYTGSF